MQLVTLLVHRDDDEMRTGLRGHITALMPQELILPKGGLTSTTSRVLRASLRNPRQHQLTPGEGFWDAEKTLQEVKQAGYFDANEGQGSLPHALQVHAVTAPHACCVSAQAGKQLLQVHNNGLRPLVLVLSSKICWGQAAFTAHTCNAA